MKNFKKITYDLLDKGGYNFLKIDLVDTVKQYIDFEMMNYEFSFLESLVGCESPLEQLFALTMDNFGLTTMVKFNPEIDVLTIENQYEVVISGNTYRLDFYIPVEYRKNNTIKLKKFAIEIDGHEFHQKTKKQVERDNERTRNLQLEGYEVIRFSGTEIYHKPHQAVSTLISLILAKANE